MTLETEMRTRGTETPTREHAAFEAYLNRIMPPELRADAPIPETWTGSESEWRQVATEARSFFRQRAIYDFSHAIAVRGYHPHELGSGELDRGSEVVLSSGRVKRPTEPTISRDLRRLAQEAALELARRSLHLDAGLQQALELGAAGAWQGQPRMVEAAVGEAQSAVRRREAELKAQRQTEAAKPILRVGIPFRATGGRTWPVGEYAITEAEAQELRDWQARLESDAQRRGWDAPEGFATNWPPFELREPSS